MNELGFNNLEQGIIIACAIAITGSIWWIALAVSSASLRTIDIASALKRIAQALENPPETIEESPESVARRTQFDPSPVPNVIEPQTFGGMSEEERASKRRATRVANCERHKEDYAAVDKEFKDALNEGRDSIMCGQCTAVALIHRPTDGRKPFLGGWK